MTTPAIRKIFFAERASIIMTRRAGYRAASREMLDRDRKRDLSSHRCAGSRRMAFGAADRIVIGVAERKSEHVAFRLPRARVRRDRVTDIARSDFAFGRMTRKTLRVCGNAGGNRPRSALRKVTRRAALRRSCRAARMQRVVERHVKTLVEFCRERFQLRRIFGRIRVTNGANIRVRTHEFAHVAIDAARVSGKFQLCSFASVTRIAVDLGVFGVRKRAVIFPGVRRVFAGGFVDAG